MSTDLTLLHPALQPLCQQFLDICGQEGLTVKILFTYRTPAQQDALYAQGRTAPGAIVTMLKGNQSLHCWTWLNGKPAAKAFDFGIIRNGVYIRDGSDPDYLKAAEIGERLGLTSGIRWKHPVDAGHLQINT